MNSFLLTISGALFLLISCGLSMPTPRCTQIRQNITGLLEKKVACNKSVVLIVPALENTNFSALKCLQNNLATIKSNCANSSTVLHAEGILKTIRNNVQNNAECIFETNATESYTDFLKRFKEFIQEYNNFCSA